MSMWLSILCYVKLFVPDSELLDFRREFAKKEKVLLWVGQGFYFAFFAMQIASFEFKGEVKQAFTGIAVICIISSTMCNGLHLWNESAFLRLHVPQRRYLIGLVHSVEMFLFSSVAYFFYSQLQVWWVLSK